MRTHIRVVLTAVLGPVGIGLLFGFMCVCMRVFFVMTG